MVNNKFEMAMFNGESICFPYKSIIVCNKTIKEAILNDQVELEAPIPYLIITNDEFTDEEIDILEDASIADCLSYTKSKPAFGGIIV